ncbi:hypothetical protein niasHT_037059 [Heterodera trifolii]|uniref:Suppressor of white apricot N-terminal domain-containing protein n=1 Tax=Heterodera trifolii TaxID=157864 RepID=A0ABD2IWJ9_9BILA
MWHEARRQEKMVRAKMVDNAKRNERRKQFYESVRKEPEGFMQLHGQRMHVHVDPTEPATDSHNAMRKWQGDPNILIDRFDVRGYLDTIPETAPNASAKKNIPKDDVIELQCDYERYRILVFNEFRKVSEKQFLNEIAAKEFWPAQQQANQSANAAYRREIEKKRKLASKRAAIAFNYADSTETAATGQSNATRENNCSSSSSSDEEDFDEMEEIDSVLDTNALSAEQAATLNKIGAHFNITSGAFLQLLSLDRKEQTSTAQIREIDKAKLALSGRHAKADRAQLKRKRALIIGNLGSNAQSSEEATTTLLSFLAASGKNELNEESSSSESGEEFVKTEFITSFGGDEEKDGANGGRGGEVAGGQNEDECVEREAVVQGPILPNREYRRLLELSRRRSNSPENAWERKDHRAEENGRSGDAWYGHRRSSRSPPRRHRRRTTRSRERERRRRSSRSRSRNSGRQRRQHRTSTLSSASPSPKRSATASTSRKTVRHAEERERSIERERKDKGAKVRRHSSSSSSRGHSYKVGNGGAKLGQQSPHFVTGRKSPTSSAESDSPLSVRSSMSESEKERIERENRKRRIRKTKRSVKAQQQTNAENGQEEAEKKAERAAKKLRQQMQKALTKTAAQLKVEEEQRQKEMLREKKRREEQLLEESRLLRKREREKRKTDDGREKERRESEAHSSVGRRRRRSSSEK